MVTKVDCKSLLEYRQKSSLVCKMSKMLQLGGRQLSIYRSKAVVSLSESSALLSFHTTSYNRYLRQFLHKFGIWTAY